MVLLLKNTSIQIVGQTVEDISKSDDDELTISTEIR